MTTNYSCACTRSTNPDAAKSCQSMTCPNSNAARIPPAEDYSALRARLAVMLDQNTVDALEEMIRRVVQEEIRKARNGF